jgi:hypothetical protein
MPIRTNINKKVHIKKIAKNDWSNKKLNKKIRSEESREKNDKKKLLQSCFLLMKQFKINNRVPCRHMEVGETYK